MILESAVQCMKSGADDYVIKEQITRLPFAIKEVLKKVRAKKEKEWLQHFLLKVSQLSVKEIGLKDFLKAIHKEIKKIMKADNFTIVLYDESTGKYTIPHHADEYDDLTTDDPISLENTLTDYIRKTAKARLITEEYESELRKEKKIQMVGTPSPVWIGAPVKDITTGKVSGVIILQDYKDKNTYNQNDVALLEIIASETGVFIDRKKDQEKLKQSEEKFRGLFREHSAVKLIINPDNGDIVEANNSAANFYGWAVDELERMNISQINTLPAEQIKKEIAKVRENLKTIFEFKHRKADGSICDVETFGSRVQIGNKMFLHSIVHDISEKKKVEEQLKLISRSVEQNPVSILITDINGYIEYTNPAFTQITGYSFEEVKGENPRILQSGEHPKTYYEELWETILNGRDWEGEFRNKRKNGEFHWEQAVISPIIDEEGKITHFVSIKEDVTEKKRIFEDLKNAKEKAEESDRLKTAFLANMSHEIRTPMNGIMGFTDLLLEPDLSSEQKDKFISIIQKSGQRMLTTVNDIVEMSKIEAGMVTVNLNKTDINQTVGELHRFFLPEAQKKGLGLTLSQLLPKQEPVIVTDQNKLDSILSNLIKNAIKYTESGNIDIGCKRKDAFITFYVKDTGIGIPENRLQAIFNRFEQADISDTRAFEGSGLGLSIAKSYLQMLGGDIWVESENGKGSVFYFTLPDNPENNQENNQEHTTTPKQQGKPADKSKEGYSGKNLKILIVEDDDSSFIYLSALLKKVECEIHRTIGGKEAVAFARQNKDIDLILMDIRLPELGGHDATREIRGFNKEVPIMAQTAHALQGDRQKALDAGCNDYIAKPVKKEELMRLIEKYT
jgi:PAS domain S-box-containing protein